MEARHRFSHWLPRLLRVEAITLYPFVFYSRPRDGTSARTLAHELVHLKQVRAHGWFRFYSSYLREYFALRRKGLKHHAAYRSISYEKEAYEKTDAV